MSSKIRRSAGSHTPLEALLHRTGLKRRDPEGDTTAFNEGQTLKILCMTWTLGEPRTRRIGAADVVMPKGGWLYLAKGRDLVWRRTRVTEEVTIPTQAELRPSARRLHFRNQTALTVTTSGGEHDIAIRTLDAHLLFLALGQSLDRPSGT